MKTVSGIFLLSAMLLMNGCRIETVDYQALSPEETEILYEHGHPELLDNVCRKYQGLFAGTDQGEWLIYGSGYRKEVEEKFVKYCGKAFKNGDGSAACSLMDYYRSKFWSRPAVFPNFLSYLRGCGNSNLLKQFITNDSMAMAVTETAVSVMKRDYAAWAGNEEKTAADFQATAAVLSESFQDLEHAEGAFVLFSSRQALLFSTLKGLKENYEMPLADLEAILAKPAHITELRAFLARVIPDVNKVSRELMSGMGELPEACGYIRTQLYSPDMAIMRDVSDIMHDFQAATEKYQKKYGQKPL